MFDQAGLDFETQTFWARLSLHDLRESEVEELHTRLRGAGYTTDTGTKRELMVDTGVAVAEHDESLRFRAFRAATSVVQVANGRASAFPLPALLKNATRTIDAEVPRNYRPVSDFMTAAWYLERSVASEMLNCTPAIIDVLELYFEKLSKVEKEFAGGLDDKAVLLDLLCMYWDRGDVGCAEVFRSFLGSPAYVSLPVEDAEAAKIRTLATLVKQVSSGTFLFGIRNESSDQVAENRLSQTTDFVNGRGAARPRPRFLEDLVLTDRARDGDCWTHPNTDARAVELAVLNHHDGHPKDLVRLYLKGISEVQKLRGVVDGGGQDTLWFVLKHWDLGDVGAVQAYAAQFQSQKASLSTKMERTVQAGSMNLDARLSALESRLRRWRL